VVVYQKRYFLKTSTGISGTGSNRLLRLRLRLRLRGYYSA